MGVTVTYEGVDVVHDASMTLRPGEVTVLVGPNGSGRGTHGGVGMRLPAA